ncbi:MAG: hypothetical protein ACI836_001415, partial [Saprospiraceae bacterium]
MQYIPNIIFLLVLLAGIGYFSFNIRKVIRNIKLGIPVSVSNKGERLANVGRIAIGQSKMVVRPVSGAMHIVVYLGFIIINIEVLEIIIDGLFGTHRIFSTFLGSFYGVLLGTFEILAVLVFAAVVVFWIRRNVIKLKRFMSKEMTGWPKNDG